MLRMNKKIALTLAAATLATAFTATTAMAGPNHRFKQRFGNYDVDVDIQARIKNRRGPAQLRVRYDVEVEGRRLARQPLDLVLTIQPQDFRGAVCNHGANVRCGPACQSQGFRGRRGFRNRQPFQVVVPLDNPTDFKRGELEFENAITIQLPRYLAVQADNLIIHAQVINQRNGRVLDTDRSLVEQGRFGRPGFGPNRPGIVQRRPARRY